MSLGLRGSECQSDCVSRRAVVTIPAGKAIVSDELNYDVAPLTDYSLTISFGNMSNTVVTGHPGSRSTSYLDTDRGAQTFAHWYIFTGIDVVADPSASAVVILGDSITDGRGSDTDGNNRWTDNLAWRLHDDPATRNVAVLNEGLGGNAVLSGGLGPPAVTRVDRDVLGQSSARWLIVMEGVNDIGVAGLGDDRERPHCGVSEIHRYRACASHSCVRSNRAAVRQVDVRQSRA